MNVEQNKKAIVAEIMEGTPDRHSGLIKDAVNFAQSSHEGFSKESGQEVILHVLNVGRISAQMKLDTDSVLAAILHQTLSPDYNEKERIERNRSEIENQFGGDVFSLVNKLEQIKLATDSRQITDFSIFNRYLLNSADDIRPILIKICDALANAQTLESLPKESRDNFATKILNIYAPLSEYFSMGQIQKELEERAFKALHPKDYRYVEKALEENNISEGLKDQYAEYLRMITDILGYKPHIFGRIKSKYSTYKKLKKLLQEDRATNIAEIKDLLAFTIVTQTEDDCFEVSNAIKALTNDDPAEFDNYISKPKPNGYKALQITTKVPEISESLQIEIIVLTHEMHYINTYGPASHIAYKASMKRFAKATDEYRWVEQIHDAINDHTNKREENRSIPISGSMFKDQIYVLTPKGTIIELNSGDTVIDFAYQVHTQIGHSAIAGVVDGTSAKLSQKLKSGETVEIVTDNNKKAPSEKFLQYANSDYTKKRISEGLRKKTV